jgi:type I site-specific restriction endonuclease
MAALQQGNYYSFVVNLDRQLVVKINRQRVSIYFCKRWVFIQTFPANALKNKTVIFCQHNDRLQDINT